MKPFVIILIASITLGSGSIASADLSALDQYAVRGKEVPGLTKYVVPDEVGLIFYFLVFDHHQSPIMGKSFFSYGLGMQFLPTDHHFNDMDLRVHFAFLRLKHLLPLTELNRTISLFEDITGTEATSQFGRTPEGEIEHQLNELGFYFGLLFTQARNRHLLPQINEMLRIFEQKEYNDLPEDSMVQTPSLKLRDLTGRDRLSYRWSRAERRRLRSQTLFESLRQSYCSSSFDFSAPY